ncbi:hypothetical protein Syun_031975 [Stephania yunnanensis]|uniref:Uncharacterized protein n=1 Tax=Stephania yunnanensis TaxID=152371 RepID=A0AAP0E035_9MAGN
MKLFGMDRERKLPPAPPTDFLPLRVTAQKGKVGASVLKNKTIRAIASEHGLMLESSTDKKASWLYTLHRPPTADVLPLWLGGAELGSTLVGNAPGSPRSKPKAPACAGPPTNMSSTPTPRQS